MTRITHPAVTKYDLALLFTLIVQECILIMV